MYILGKFFLKLLFFVLFSMLEIFVSVFFDRLLKGECNEKMFFY